MKYLDFNNWVTEAANSEQIWLVQFTLKSGMSLRDTASCKLRTTSCTVAVFPVPGTPLIYIHLEHNLQFFTHIQHIYLTLFLLRFAFSWKQFNTHVELLRILLAPVYGSLQASKLQRLRQKSHSCFISPCQGFERQTMWTKRSKNEHSRHVECLWKK